MKRWRWIGGAVVAVVLAVAGVSAYMAANAQMAVQTENAFSNNRDFPSPLVGATAPNFSLSLAGGGKATLDDYRGKTVLLTFWSSF